MKMPTFALPKGPQLPIPKIGAAKDYLGRAERLQKEGRDAQQETLKAAGQDKIDNYDVAMSAATIVLAAVSGTDFKHPISTIGYGVQAVIDGAKGSEARSDAQAEKLKTEKRNPFFDDYKASPGVSSPVTQRYLTSRRWKKIGGSAVQTVGSLSSLIPVLAHTNIPGATYHLHATCLSRVHAAQIKYIREKYEDQELIRDFCDLIESAKMIKYGVRAASTLGAIIPGASMPVSIATAAIKAGIKLTAPAACYAAAAAIHWTAYKEQGYFEHEVVPDFAHYMLPPVGGSKPLPPLPTSKPLPPIVGIKRAPPLPAEKKLPELPPTKTLRAGPAGPSAGPASAIFWEIFTKRGATRILGNYDIDALVREPAGWLALGDKLTLI